MRRVVLSYAIIILLLGSNWTSAQKVLYSPFINDPFDIAGKVGNFYWIERREKPKPIKKHTVPNPDDLVEKQVFDIFNEHMYLVNRTDPYKIADTTVKEYYVCNDDFFDQLILLACVGKTNFVINRFSGEGEMVASEKIIFTLPFNEPGNSYCLIRSEDKSKLLLLCFRFGPTAGMQIHAALFDNNWNLLQYKTYQHLYFTQPFIQDDFVSYPVEYFSTSPVKLANDGEWLMATPSRTNNNFLLFHFTGRDGKYLYKEIRLPADSKWEDVALSVEDDLGEAYAGVLSDFTYSTLKDVEVIHYSLSKHEFDFDSSYRFNTLMAFNTKDENATPESFIAVPGSGFMLLKEYGVPFPDTYQNDTYYNLLDLSAIFSGDSIMNIPKPIVINRNGYTRYNKLGGARRTFERGDLCMFYFPAHRTDSSWSGIINEEQVTDFNTPNLSYLVVPLNQKIFLLYNSFFRYTEEQQFGNSTIIDYKGNLVSDEGLVYWRYKNSLLFQRSRQISENEVALHYENFSKSGFAIIRF